MHDNIYVYMFVCIFICTKYKFTYICRYEFVINKRLIEFVVYKRFIEFMIYRAKSLSC